MCAILESFNRIAKAQKQQSTQCSTWYDRSWAVIEEYCQEVLISWMSTILQYEYYIMKCTSDINWKQEVLLRE